MRNIFLTLAFTALVFSNISFYAASPVHLTFEDGAFVLQEEFKEIKVTELPSAVQEAVTVDFPKATILKAYMNEVNEYKLDLSMSGTIETVYADATGKWINK
ncbi:hypothetical protein ACFFVB_04920 [Formosa undariae]|uniref:Beta-lactamase-inhibitor-like PepSY-like domain-containing protein n=1 Tax=Formosa undariae TaxID=1325436 RepID=A0ABV5EZ57_9FLAO